MKRKSEQGLRNSREADFRFTTWSDVRLGFDQLLLENLGKFDAQTIANALDLLRASETAAALPSGLGKGYWPTIIFYWHAFEIEVFEDRLEVYRFRDDGRADIRYEEHIPGVIFSPLFLSELSSFARLHD